MTDEQIDALALRHAGILTTGDGLRAFARAVIDAATALERQRHAGHSNRGDRLMNDRSNYATHADLLAQVADSAEEDAHVRRVLGGRVSEAELDEYERWRRAPVAVGATNHAHRYSTCHGPCEQGRNPCPSPDACECAERPAPSSGDFWRVLALVLASWGAVAFVLLVMGVRL